MRYDASGNFLGVLIDDPNNLDQPYGMALSPDRTKLYVGSQQTNSVVRYDFDGTTASNPTVVINSSLSIPANLLFSEDGQTLYVANLGFFLDGSTVSQFDPNGVYLGALTGGPETGRTGLALDPAGSLMVATLNDATVYKLNSETGVFDEFIETNVSLDGAGNLLVRGNDLYVASTPVDEPFGGTVLKFDATTGDEVAFNTISADNEFLGGLALAPDGSGFLLGYIELGMGNGRIERYSFDGTYLGLFANNSGGNPNAGFIEAAGLLTIFDPADFDTDGDVDKNDLALWETAYGLDGSADADFDGDSDGNDFLIWQRQYTGDLSLLASSAAAVPEPAAAVLFSLGVIGVWPCGRRRSRLRSRNDR